MFTALSAFSQSKEIVTESLLTQVEMLDNWGSKRGAVTYLLEN